eukprot:GSA120T00001371001.1
MSAPTRPSFSGGRWYISPASRIELGGAPVVSSAGENNTKRQCLGISSSRCARLRAPGAPERAGSPDFCKNRNPAHHGEL